MDNHDTSFGRRGKALAAAGLIAATLGVAWAPASSATELASVDAPAAASVLAAREDRTPTEASGAFIYRNGRYTPLDGVPGVRVTIHVGLNNHGQIVGSYPVDESTLLRGFVRSRWGDYQGFDAALGAPDRLTAPIDINDRGAIAGYYAVGSVASPEPVEFHGFVTSQGGSIRTVDIPRGSSTIANGINDRGAVVGAYVDTDGRSHGYLLERGAVTPIDPPKAGDVYPGTAQVQAFDINDRGQIVGVYPDAQGTFHGFLYDKGKFTQIDPPQAAGNRNGFAASAAFGVNNRGQVVGQYVDAEGVLHGYLWERGRGFETIDPPGGAANSCAEDTPIGQVCGTVAADINNRGHILLPAPGDLFKADGPG